MVPVIGTTIAHFRITHKLGEGGMGEVYRARDTRLGRDVAIKVLPEALTSDPERLARLKGEARLLAALNHPHIATIHSLEEFHPSAARVATDRPVPSTGSRALALVMELVEGPTLAERIGTTPLTLADTIHIARQLVDALDAAHAKGIVHRDLKPANIKLAGGRHLKVLDFGLAIGAEPKEHEDSRLTTITSVRPGLGDAAGKGGAIVGTPAYMSPEQARSQAVDARTDVWAFGCVLYEMLTGRRAFGRDTFFETIAATLEREPDWNALPPTTPAALRQLLQRCLEKDPQRRLHPIAQARPELDDRVETATALAAPPPAAAASLAVLPFANASGDAEMEYLSDGLTETIISNVSQLRQVRVMARSTVFRFKGRSDDPREIGRTLGVRVVANGRVQLRGDRLVISVELIDVENGWQIWGAQYRKPAADIFAIEEEISREISANLQLNLTPRTEERLGKRYTDNVRAYHLYLKGKFCWDKRTKDSLLQAIEYFRQALEVDPTYALAHAGIAATYPPMMFYGQIAAREGLAKADAAARAALQIDPQLSEAHTVLAMTSWAQGDQASAERELRAVVDADPNYAWARQLLAEVLTAQGRFRAGIAETMRALENDPLSLSLNAWAAQERYFAGEYDAAVEQCRRTIEMEAHYFLAHSILGMVYGRQGRLADAISELEIAREQSNDSPFVRATLGTIYAGGGREAEARAILQHLDSVKSESPVSPTLRAMILAPLGEIGGALTCLEQASEERDPQLGFMKVDPRLERLHGEPRFLAVLRRHGLA